MRVTEPEVKAVTSPALVTLATDVLLETQFPPLFGVTLVVKPRQTEVGPPRTGAPGIALITTSFDDNEAQLFAFSTLKV